MAKLNRKLQKIFASSAQVAELTAFGTEKTGSPVDSSDVEVLQTAAYETGWSSSIKNDKAPYMSEMNGVQYGLSYQLKYLFQNGMAEWLATEAYYIGSFCREGSKLYVSKADNNLNHQPSLDTTNTYWDEFKTGSSSYHPTIFSHQWCDHIKDDIQWLRADTFSWQSGSVYVTAYNELVSQYNAQKVDLYAYKDTADNIIYVNTTTPTTIDYAYGGAPIHQLGLITAVSGSDITYNNVVYSRYSTGDTEDAIHSLDGTIYYVRTTKGYKIADSTQETAILNKYNTDGIAWYYILDTTNTQFKLPRTKFGFEGLRTSVGNDIAESLPNITGTYRDHDNAVDGIYGDGCFNVTGATGRGAWNASDGQHIVTFDASRSSSAYQDNAPVQERATQMYLYFYVGEYAQTAIEQTAGITSEQLNNKLDISTYNNNPRTNAIYLKTTYVNGTSGYNIWSNGYCEQWGRNTANLATVTLLKEYNSTNYTIQTCSYFYSGRSAYANEIPYVDTITVNSFRTWVYTYSHTLWKTSGYLAEGSY